MKVFECLYLNGVEYTSTHRKFHTCRIYLFNDNSHFNNSVYFLFYYLCKLWIMSCGWYTPYLRLRRCYSFIYIFLMIKWFFLNAHISILMQDANNIYFKCICIIKSTFKLSHFQIWDYIANWPKFTRFSIQNKLFNILQNI